MNGGLCTVVFMHPEFSLFGSGRAVLTPVDAFDAGMGALLDRIADRLAGEATLMLTPGAAFALGYPDDMPEGGVLDHPVVLQARERGWSARKLRKWTSFVRGDQVVHVGLDPTTAVVQFPLRCRNEWETVQALEGWSATTGKSWHGTPGIAGMSVLRGLATGRAWATWKPAAGYPDGAYELDYKRQHWQGEPVPEGTPLVGYDANRMYLAAARVVRLHPWTLKQTGAIGFDKKLAGWWLVDLPRWAEPRMPDPAGRRPGESGPKWVTTPTLELIQEVTDGVPVLDSWTGPGKTILKNWAEKLDAVTHYAAGTDDDGQAYVDALRLGAKEAYRWTIGSLKSTDSMIYRPDWHYSVIAMARANLWRRAWSVGQACGRWPVTIDVDNLIYADTGEVPAGLGIGDRPAIGTRLGQFKVKAVSA